MMFLLANWRMVGLALLLAFMGFQQVRLSNSRAEVASLRLAIVQGVADAENATRRAVEAAREQERRQRDSMQAAADAATAKARADAQAARNRLTALQRAIQEASDADPTVDAWRTTPLPEPIRVLLDGGGQAPSDRG